MTDSQRTETGASWIAILIAAILVAVAAFASGCGPRAVRIAGQYERAQASCLAAAHEVVASCPSVPASAECLARFDAVQSTCDAELHRICSQRGGVCP